MASYFRSFFWGQTGTTSNRKSHNRSLSASSVQQPNYIYAVPGTTPSSATSSRSVRERSNSYVTRTNTPSPLRYAAYDSGVDRVKNQSLPPQTLPPSVIHSQQLSGQLQQKPARVRLYRSSSYRPGEPPAPYPIYSHSSSFSSVHSASSSSIHPGSSASGHRPTPARSSSSGSFTHSERATYAEPRPVLKQSHTWQAGMKSGSQAHVSFLNPNRPAALHMHPLLAYSRLHRPPISYDVTYTPSSRTVVDRSTHTAVPAHTLSQPATDPPTLSRLVFRSDRLPWPIVASSSHRTSGARFYLAGSSSSHRNAGTPVTNLDVLYALHNTLSVRVTQEEWEALVHGSRAQRRVTRAYEKRCNKMGGGWDGGVRRIDYLGEKTRLIGVEVDKTAEGGGAGKLVFGKT